MGLARSDINLNVDRRVESLQHLGHCAVVDEEVRPARCCRFTIKDLAQRFPLLSIGSLIDDCLLFPVALRNLSRPLQDHEPVEAIEAGVVEVAVIDVAADEGFALAVCRGCVELTGAAAITVAVAVLGASNHPLVCHAFASKLIQVLPGNSVVPGFR
jgi:hypothetical protein